MSETIQSISNGTYTIGNTSATNFIAGPGIVIDQPSAGTVRIGNDETVLYSGAYTAAFSVSEPITNFNNIRVVCHNNRDNEYAFGSIVNTNYFTFGTINWTDNTDNNPLQIFGGAYTSTNGVDFTYAGGNQIYFAKNSSNIGGGGPKTGVYAITVSQVIGYNRISGGNT
jgi:hypothetical protein